MTAPQSAQFTANGTFLHVVDNNEAIVLSVPIFAKHTRTLRVYMSKAQAADKESNLATNGMTQDKNQIKGTLYERMTDLTTLVSAFAADRNDNVLANRVNNFPSVFGRTRQNDVATLCRGILDDVKPFLPDLADYTITADTLQEIYDLIDAYEGKVPETRSKRKEKTVSTTSRDDIFDQMTDLMVNKLLKVAVAFKKDNLDFYNKIVAAASIDATSTKPTLLKVVLKNKTGTRAIQTMTARSLDSDTHLTPNDKGVIVFKFEKGGLKDIEIPIEGGEPIKLTSIRVKQGKTKTIAVSV